MEKQQLEIKGRDNEKIIIEYEEFNKTYVFLELKSYKKEPLKIKVHTALFASLVSVLQRVLLKWDGVILVTGDVGDGKSTLAQLISTIWEWFFGRQQDLSIIVWTSENFTTLIEREDNETGCILWDEAIQGGTGRDTLTKQGQTLKKAFVTKRYKRHLYLLLVDEIQEYNKKILSRCRLWVHIHTEGLQRGYFKIYNNKTQIRRMYRKIKKYDLELEEVMKSEHPQFRGYQPDTSDLFYNPKDYQDKKAEETNKEEATLNTKDNKLLKQRNDLIKELIKIGHKQQQIADIVGVSRVQVSHILNGKG